VKSNHSPRVNAEIFHDHINTVFFPDLAWIQGLTRFAEEDPVLGMFQRSIRVTDDVIRLLTKGRVRVSRGCPCLWSAGLSVESVVVVQIECSGKVPREQFDCEGIPGRVVSQCAGGRSSLCWQFHPLLCSASWRTSNQASGLVYVVDLHN
jgi:hypothetical protein